MAWIFNPFTGTFDYANNASGAAVSTFSGGTTGLTPAAATSGAVTLGGTLVVANGGTGFSTIGAGNIPYATAANTLGSSTDLTYVSNTLQITNLSGVSARLLYLSSGFNRSDIFFQAGTAHGIRMGATTLVAQFEAVDYTGAASFSPLQFGGSTVTVQISGVAKLSLDANGNIYGTSGTTGMTNGFFYIPSAAGAPSGTPTAISGRLPMYYDSTNNNFYVYNTAWKKVTLA